MAIQLSYTDPVTQVSSNYWDCVSIEQDPVNSMTKFTLGLYASLSAFAGGAKPITAIDFEIPGVISVYDCFAYIIANYSEFSAGVII